MRLPITDIRKHISEALRLGGGLSPEIGSIKLVERRNRERDAEFGIQCLTYLFEHDRYAAFREVGDAFLSCEGHHEVEQPQVGDLAIYLVEIGGDREQTHIGRIKSPGRVLSKWGYGHVYEHTLDEVPVEYGEHVRFFRPNALS